MNKISWNANNIPIHWWSGIRDTLKRSDCLLTRFCSKGVLQQLAILFSRATSILYRTLFSYVLPSQDYSSLQEQAPAPLAHN